MRPGGSVFDSVVSFEVARSGKLSAVLLGAYQVAKTGTSQTGVCLDRLAAGSAARWILSPAAAG